MRAVLFVLVASAIFSLSGCAAPIDPYRLPPGTLTDAQEKRAERAWARGGNGNGNASNDPLDVLPVSPTLSLPSNPVSYQEPYNGLLSK